MSDNRLIALISAYRKCKQAVEIIERTKIKPLKDKMAEIEAEVLRIMNEQGATRIKTPAGVAQRRVMESFRIAEPDTFLGYVIKNQAWHLLDLRCNKTAAKEMMETEGSPPPGVDHHSVVRVTFPAK